MIFILGKTCAGKDAVAKKLIEKYDYRKFITYTTRPPREREVDGKDYHFINEEEFLEKVNSNFFLEYKKYDTIHGTWYYGSAREDYFNADKNSVVIISPSGYEDFLTDFREKNSDEMHISIYLYANNKTILERLKRRGDDKSEAERRIKQDNKDFKDVMNKVDKIVYSNDDKSIDEIANKIHLLIQNSRIIRR